MAGKKILKKKRKRKLRVRPRAPWLSIEDEDGVD